MRLALWRWCSSPSVAARRFKQLRLCGAVRADEEQRALVRERGEHDGIEKVEAEEIEAAHQPQRTAAWGRDSMHDAKLLEFAPRLRFV
jgi:hypothetical protein